MDIELGCGWGSTHSLDGCNLSQQPDHGRIKFCSAANLSKIGVKNGIDNVRVACDMNDFTPEDTYDRVVSVEMFEHLRNYRAMLKRVASWLKDDGKLFLHIFVHRQNPYLFEVKSDDDWMSKYFFTGGMMPSDDLFHYCRKIFTCKGTGA